MGIGVEISIAEEGSVHVVSIDGRVDATTTPTVEKKLEGLLKIANKILIDASEINYLSSAGMRLFLSMTKKMQAEGKQVVFFNMTDDVMEIIKMAGFERILKIFPSKKEAVKALE